VAKSTTLVIRILADATQSARAMATASSNASKFASGMRTAAIPATAMVVALGAMGKAAADDAKAQAVLANSLRKSAGATTAQIAATEDWVSKTALATGIADDQLRPALAAVARATGDVTIAQQAMATVMDVSVATGKDTETVANAVAKAYAGNATALGKLVPGLDKAVLKSGDMTAIMAELAAKTGGAAAAAADTVAGRWQRTVLAFDEAKESIGAGLLPIFDKLSTTLVTAGTWMANNTTTVTTLVIVFGSLAAAVLLTNGVMAAYTAATTIATAATKLFSKEGLIARTATAAWAAVQWVLNAALAANPIGLIVIAVAALVAGLVIAYNKSETFRRIVAGAWSGIKTAAVAAWNFIKSYVLLPWIIQFKLISAAVGIAVDLISKAWDALKAPMKAVWDWIKSYVIDPMTTAFNAVKAAVEKVISWINKVKIPKPLQSLINKVTGNAIVVQAAPMPPPPRGRGEGPGGGPAAMGTTTTAGGGAALASLTAAPQVVVQVSDRKMANLIDVKLRATATSAARDLTRRRVVVV